MCAVWAAELWYIWPGLGPWPLLLAAAGWAASALATKSVVWRRDVNWPLVLFLASAVGGVLIAYNGAVAWNKFWLVIGGLALYASFVRAGRIQVGRWSKMSLTALVLGVLPTVIAVFFLLFNDWTRWTGKLPWLDPAMRWLSAWQPDLVRYRLNPNATGGVIAAFLPLQIAGLWAGKRSPGLVWFSALLVGLSALGLLMSASRGAWLALCIVGSAYGLWRLAGRLTERFRLNKLRQTRAILWVAAMAMIASVIVGVLSQTRYGPQFLTLVQLDRMDIWQNSLDLARDYAFTGVGLGTFEMAYSSYVMLLHVGHTVHAHNLFLDIWLELGLIGLFAFGWMVLKSVRSRGSDARWRTAALIALGVILLHGLGDDAFYGYGGQAAPLLFVPLALLAGPEKKPASGPIPSAPRLSRYPVQWIAGCSIVAAIALATWQVPKLQAAFQANLGALFQTRAELVDYHWPDWPLQDVRRRSPHVDLAPAIAHYDAALALDPDNASANRRMGQIELSWGQYEAACRHLQAAYRVAPNQRANRQLLGECYALAGEIESATALWQTVDLSQSQLVLRQWWYEYLNERQYMARVAQAAAALEK